MRRIKKKIEKFLNTSELSIIKKLYEFHDKKDYKLILKLLNKKLD